VNDAEMKLEKESRLDTFSVSTFAQNLEKMSKVLSLKNWLTMSEMEVL